MNVRMDTDQVQAAGKLAGHQRTHLYATQHYVTGACERYDAFRGVLNLFDGPYRSAVTTVHDGLRDSVAISTRMEGAINTARTSFIETDRAAYQLFRKHHPGAPPYHPPGSGQTDFVPGSIPTARRPGEDPGEVTMPPWLKKALSSSANDSDLPDWFKDPKSLGQDKLKEWLVARYGAVSARIHYDEYMRYRSQGMTPAEAWARTRNAGAGDHFSHDPARDAALAHGATLDEADRAGDRATQRANANASRAADGIGAFTGLANEGYDLYNNVRHTIDVGQEIGQTNDDIRDYDSFESQGPDEDLKRWANT